MQGSYHANMCVMNLPLARALDFTIISSKYVRPTYNFLLAVLAFNIAMLRITGLTYFHCWPGHPL